MRSSEEISRVLDAERLRALDATGLLDAAPVPSLDRLAALTARLVHADAAFVSLVAADRQVFAGACGPPLSHSYCRQVVEDEAPVIITTAPAYAGFPLRDPAGHILGAFCVLDSRPRDWTDEELSIVRDLAGAAESEVALRLAHQDQLRSAERLADERTFLQALLDSLDTGVVACDSEGKLAIFNRALRAVHGADVSPIPQEEWADNYGLYDADGRTPLPPEQVPLARAYGGEIVQGQEVVVHPARRFIANARPIDTEDGRRLGAVAAMHDITESRHGPGHRPRPAGAPR
ncbi:MAG: GAF domain-containing protein [Actinoplanes sp.]